MCNSIAPQVNCSSYNRPGPLRPMPGRDAPREDVLSARHHPHLDESQKVEQQGQNRRNWLGSERRDNSLVFSGACRKRLWHRCMSARPSVWRARPKCKQIPSNDTNSNSWNQSLLLLALRVGRFPFRFLFRFRFRFGSIFSVPRFFMVPKSYTKWPNVTYINIRLKWKPCTGKSCGMECGFHKRRPAPNLIIVYW